MSAIYSSYKMTLFFSDAAHIAAISSGLRRHPLLLWSPLSLRPRKTICRPPKTMALSPLTFSSQSTNNFPPPISLPSFTPPFSSFFPSSLSTPTALNNSSSSRSLGVSWRMKIKEMASSRVSAISGAPGLGGEETGSGIESGSESEEEEEGEKEMKAPERWDVLGLGQAMVDFSGMVDDDFLERVGIEKGTRKIVNHEERGRVLRAMDGCSYKAAAGGSLSNTLVALARLGSQPIGGPSLNVAMAGSVGSDPLGGFYRAKLRRANVDFLSAPIKDGTTGTVIVLTTPDAQRTMLAYQGMSSTVNYDPCLAGIIAKTNILVIEGYLFEFPHTAKAIMEACEDAHKNGALIAVTASDVSCIERCYDHFWEIIENYADIVFTNSDEARALSSKENPISAARYLSHFVPLVSVTDGPRGSYIGIKGEDIYVPPSHCMPVDTCGAGDAYASGILYGILRGASDLKGIGMLASKVAAVVVGQQGTRLRVQDAVDLAESFAFHIESSKICWDVGSDHISSQ
ncbi:hypothetical protein CKAN_00926300 [Cinnamomum micranthum f. kanehirae]|uniref:Carbohydrate kinase PfkB domain-containing protein n=1 Tax=Cinnamomum micranthum f. kanehirae TaxID=337451 RepID=A0A3S3Q8D2_9MAGN|nr:hypothetical protein CKAN_00926300 [Cinnamomum micranthum f. kanehirae]